MNFQQWIASVSTEITQDPLWKVEAYRLALFVAEIGWHDVSKLMQDRRTISLADQLYRALGSIGGNVSEGYSRGSGKDRARFYEYGLGSSRESRHWYYNGRHVLGKTVASHRMRIQSQIIRLLLTMIPEQRGYALHDGESAAGPSGDFLTHTIACDERELPELLNEVPFA